MIAEQRHIEKWQAAGATFNTVEPNMVFDWIAKEARLTIRVNHQRMVSIACSPVDCMDLALGYLVSESVIRGLSDIDTLTFDVGRFEINIIAPGLGDFDLSEWREQAALTSGCGGATSSQAEGSERTARRTCVPAGRSPAFILAAVRYAKNVSEWHTRTGCVHVAALFGSEKILVREDIGRHNAIDKVIGAGLRCGVPFDEAVLYCSGRSSSDMIAKAVRAGIPVVVSRSAPTSMAIDIAENAGILLVGFARGNRFNVYAHTEHLHNIGAIAESGHSGPASPQNGPGRMECPG